MIFTSSLKSLTDSVGYLSDRIWDPSLWLPFNHTWSDIEAKNQKIYVGRPRDLCYSFLMAFVMYFFRIVMEKYIWEPIGKSYGLTHRKYGKPVQDSEMEAEYRENKRPNNTQIKEISKRLKKEERYINMWYRRRRNMFKSDILTKFSESGWRLVYYLSIFIIGCWVLSDQEFIWDTRLMWSSAPFFEITPLMFWYISAELGYYWSSLFTIFYDVKRKDFLEMLLHHVVTIFLIGLAWIQNFIPITLYVLCIHDFVDYFMEAAKMCKYIKKDFICNLFFIVFTMAWFFSRLVFYPYKIILSTFTEKYYDHFGSCVCQLFLLVLQVLHIIWFWMILRIAIQALDDTGIHKDSRSDSEMSASETEDSVIKKASKPTELLDRINSSSKLKKIL